MAGDITKRVVVYHKASGRRYERSGDIAADWLASGEFQSTDPAIASPIPAPTLPVEASEAPAPSKRRR